MAATFAAAAIASLGSVVGRAQSPAANNGAADGLQPKFVDVKALGGTIRTRYYDVGQGEPLVLVHGGGFAGYYSANVWSKNIPGLGQKFHVYAPDKLAAGMTDNPPSDADYNIQGEVEHVYRFIQTLNLGRVHLVGQSRGAGLALMLAMKYPEIVRTLVLVDSITAAPVLANANIHEEIMAKCPKDRDESWKCEMRALSYGPNAKTAFPDESFVPGLWMGNQPKSKTTMAKIASRAGQPKSGEFNEWKKRLHERLRSEPILPMPLLLYWATDDPQASIEHGMALFDVLAAQHPQVRLLFANNAGHFHFREYPEEFDHNVISFIEYWKTQPTGARTSKWATIRADR